MCFIAFVDLYSAKIRAHIIVVKALYKINHYISSFSAPETQAKKSQVTISRNGFVRWAQIISCSVGMLWTAKPSEILQIKVRGVYIAVSLVCSIFVCIFFVCILLSIFFFLHLKYWTVCSHVGRWQILYLFCPDVESVYPIILFLFCPDVESVYPTKTFRDFGGNHKLLKVYAEHYYMTVCCSC